MGNRVSAHLITHQCLELDFCVEAAIRSALDFCDDIYINDGGSTDGTLELLFALKNEYGKDRIKLYERVWKHDRRMWADEKNFILDKIPNDAYVLCLDADEVIHEDDMPKIKALVAKGFPSISFDVIHFYGRPTNYIEGPNWYKSHTRMWKRSTGIRIVHRENGCADDVLWPSGHPAHFYGHTPSGARIFHYGNCRSPQALGRKAKKADDLYQNSKAYKDGSLAESRSFTYDFDNIQTKVFENTHPKYILDWYNRHKDQETTFVAGEGKINKLWCFEV